MHLSLSLFKTMYSANEYLMNAWQKKKKKKEDEEKKKKKKKYACTLPLSCQTFLLTVTFSRWLVFGLESRFPFRRFAPPPSTPPLLALTIPSRWQRTWKLNEKKRRSLDLTRSLSAPLPVYQGTARAVSWPCEAEGMKIFLRYFFN